MSSDMSTSVEEVINDYIHEHWSKVLWIKSTDDRRGSDSTSTLVVPEALPRNELVARYETDLKEFVQAKSEDIIKSVRSSATNNKKVEKDGTVQKTRREKNFSTFCI